MLVFQLYLSVNFFESLSHLRFSEISANNSGKLWIDSDILRSTKMMQLHILHAQPMLIIIHDSRASHHSHVLQHFLLNAVHPGYVDGAGLDNSFFVVVDEGGEGVGLQVFGEQEEGALGFFDDFHDGDYLGHVVDGAGYYED